MVKDFDYFSTAVHGTDKAVAPAWQKYAGDKEGAAVAAPAYGKKGGKGGKAMPGMKKGKAKPWLLKAKSTTTTEAPTTTANAILEGSPVENSIFISKLFDALAAEMKNATSVTAGGLSPEESTTAPSPAAPLSPNPTPVAPEDKKLFENLVLLSLLKPRISKTTSAPTTESLPGAPTTISATANGIGPGDATTAAISAQDLASLAPAVRNWTDTAEILKLLAPQISSILQSEAYTLNDTSVEEPTPAELQTIISLLPPTAHLPAPMTDAPTSVSPLLQLLLSGTTEGSVAPPESTDSTVVTTEAPLPLSLILQLLQNSAAPVATSPGRVGDSRLAMEIEHGEV